MRNFNISCQRVGLFFKTPFRKTHWLSLKFEDPLKQNKKCTLQTKGGCSLANKESASYAKTEEMLMPYLKFLIKWKGRLKFSSSFSEVDSAASVTPMVIVLQVLIRRWILVGGGIASLLGSRDGSISVVDLISSIRPPASTAATASTAGQE